MSAANTLCQQIESRARMGARLNLPALLPQRPAPETVPTGIADVDALTAGLPRGALTEICGPASSGRTSLLLSLLAAATHRGEVCALVDATDAFDPHSAAAAGVELERLLWVRAAGAPAAVVRATRTHMRGQDALAPAGGKPALLASVERALKAADLLLAAGGFGVVALDLGDVPPASARRIPLTSWFRFRRTVENTPTVLVVLEQEPWARTCASLVLRLQTEELHWSVAADGSAVKKTIPRDAWPPGARPADAGISSGEMSALLRGLRVHTEVARARTWPGKNHHMRAAFLAQPEWRS